MWEGAVVNQFEDFFGIFLEGVRKTTKGLRIAGDLAKIQTWYLQSRKQAYQPYRTATVGVLMRSLLAMRHYMAGVANQTSFGCRR
jgi:hypothetical protein